MVAEHGMPLDLVGPIGLAVARVDWHCAGGVAASSGLARDGSKAGLVEVQVPRTFGRLCTRRSVSYSRVGGICMRRNERRGDAALERNPDGSCRSQRRGRLSLKDLTLRLRRAQAWHVPREWPSCGAANLHGTAWQPQSFCGSRLHQVPVELCSVPGSLVSPGGALGCVLRGGATGGGEDTEGQVVNCLTRLVSGAGVRFLQLVAYLTSDPWTLPASRRRHHHHHQPQLPTDRDAPSRNRPCLPLDARPSARRSVATATIAVIDMRT